MRLFHLLKKVIIKLIMNMDFETASLEEESFDSDEDSSREDESGHEVRRKRTSAPEIQVETVPDKCLEHNRE